MPVCVSGILTEHVQMVHANCQFVQQQTLETVAISFNKLYKIHIWYYLCPFYVLQLFNFFLI